jgi:hypothetical protein
MISLKSILFLTVLALIGATSWLAGRRARRVLSESLGREIQAGEETSLRAWMSVPDATLATADDQLRNHTAEAVIGALDSLGGLSHRRQQDHEPYSKPNSIR